MKNVLITAGLYTASAAFTNDITTAWLFVPLNILFACSVGTACAFAWADKPVEPRRKMWGLILACILMGAAFTALCNMAMAYWLPTLKIEEGAQAGLGAVISFITKSFLPWLADTVGKGKWLSWLPWIKKE